MRSRAYRLTFEAPVRPAWFQGVSDEGVDVEVVLTDDLPDDLPASDERLHLAYEDIAALSVEGGRRVRIRPEGNLAPQLLELMLSGPIAGIVLHQRDHLVMHASAVRIGNRAVIFTGGSTWGKSTTATRLYLDGHACIADDVVPVRRVDDTVVVTPGYAAHKLWPDAVLALGLDPDSLPAIGVEDEKRRLDAPDGFATDDVPVARIYVLTPGSSTAIGRLDGHEAYVELLRHSYLAHHLGLPERQATHLHQAEQILELVSVRRLLQGPIEELSRLSPLIEADLGHPA